MAVAGARLLSRAGPRAGSWFGAWAALWVCAICAGCAEPIADPAVDRSTRYGIFRDLVLYPRPPDRGGPFFLDRFETTRRDWSNYRRAIGEPVDPVDPAVGESVPITGIDLYAARDYARWRFCRLPRADEWRHAATGGGAYAFPWGNRPERTWLNGAEIGLDRPAPVGTFESGRQSGGAYDLLGNVAEWTESIPEDWLRVDVRERSFTIELPEVQLLVLEASLGLQMWRIAGSPLPGPWLRLAGASVPERAPVETGQLRPTAPLRRLWRSTADRVWRIPGVPAPGGWLFGAWGRDLPRVVVGGHFRGRVLRTVWGRPLWRELLLGRQWLRYPTERGSTTGVRLAADPVGLLESLLREVTSPTDREVGLLVAFVRNHRSVLRRAWPRARARVATPGVLGPLLATEIGA